MAYVNVPAYGGFGGFSLGKLTSWIGNTAAAVATGNTAAIISQVTQAIPGTSARPPPAATPVPVTPIPPAPSILSPGGFVEKNQTTLLLVAAGLGAFLLFSRRRGGRR